MAEHPPRSENTPLEWHEKLRGLIEGTAERFTASKNYLNARAKEIDAQAEMSGTEKAFRRMGENYNKLTLVHKLGIGVFFGTGAAISIASFAPVMALGFGVALGVQRAYGLGGAFVSREKALQAKKVGESEQLLSVKERAMLGAMLYTIGMSFAISGGVELANEHGVVERAREWFGGMFGEQQTAGDVSAPEAPAVEVAMPSPEPAPAPEVSVAEAPPDAAVPPMQEPAAVATAGEIESPPAPVTPEMPSISVEATKGRGYEYMLERVWDQLQGKHLDASQYAEGSDIRRLLEADAQSIDGVVHRIAMNPEHGFFNADGTSVRINMDSQMTINAEGNIELDGAVKAPDNAPTTPVYHPEVSVPGAETTVTPAVSAQEVAPPEAPVDADVSLSPSAETAETEYSSGLEQVSDTQPPAPIVDHSLNSLVVNRYGLNVSLGEPHIYSDANERHLFVYGGTPMEMKKTMLEYLAQHQDKVVFAADETGKLRLSWHLVGGRIEPAGAPVQTEGFFNSIFNFFRGSSWMKPPQPDEFRKIIK